MEEKIKNITPLLKELNQYMSTSLLGAYIGLHNVRLKDKKDPEACAYVRMARRRFAEEEYQKFSELIAKISEAL